MAVRWAHLLLRRPRTDDTAEGGRASERGEMRTRGGCEDDYPEAAATTAAATAASCVAFFISEDRPKGRPRPTDRCCTGFSGGRVGCVMWENGTCRQPRYVQEKKCHKSGLYLPSNPIGKPWKRMGVHFPSVHGCSSSSAGGRRLRSIGFKSYNSPRSRPLFHSTPLLNLHSLVSPQFHIIFPAHSSTYCLR